MLAEDQFPDLHICNHSPIEGGGGRRIIQQSQKGLLRWVWVSLSLLLTVVFTGGLVWRYLTRAAVQQRYNDLVAGHVGLIDYPKSVEIQLFALALGAVVSAGALLGALSWGTRGILAEILNKYPTLQQALERGMAAVRFTLAIVLRGGATFLVSVAILSSAVEGSVSLGALSGSIATQARAHLVITACSIVLLQLATLFFGNGRDRAIALGVQGLAPVAWLPFLVVRTSGIETSPIIASWPLWALWLLLSVIHMEAWRRGMGAILPGRSSRVMLPTTLLFVVSWFHYHGVSYSPFTGDDFHIGENLLPLHQILLLGRRAYADHAPIQAGTSVVHGLVTMLFYGGSISLFPLAQMTTTALIVGLTACVGQWAVPSYWIVVLFALISFPERAVLVPLAACCLVLVSRLSDPGLRAFGAGVVALGSFLWLPSFGGAVGAVAGFVVLAPLVPTVMEGKRSTVDFLVRCVVGCLALLPLVWVCGPFLKGALDFVLQSGGVNDVAYGFPYLQGQHYPPTFGQRFSSETVRYAVFEVLRFGLIGLACAIAAFFLMGEHPIRNRRVSDRGIFCLMIIFQSLVMASYIAGRVDSEHFSRGGAMGHLVAGVLLPLSWIMTGRGRSPIFGALCCSVVCACFPIIGWPSLSGTLMAHQVGMAVPSGVVPVSSVEGLQGSGKKGGYFPGERVGDIDRVARVFNRFLRPGETFLDLTNRSALYVMLDLPVPVNYAAVYLQVTEAVQRQAIASLERKNPPVVFLGPSQHFDGVLPSVRDYRVFRWLLTRSYRYVYVEGLDLLVESSRLNDLEIRSYSMRSPEFSRVVAMTHLGLLPRAWGRSLRTLSDRFSEWKEWRAQGEQRFTASNAKLGLDRDFAQVQIACRETGGSDRQHGNVDLVWTDDDGAETRVSFGVKSGEHLVPLGSLPRWSLSRVKDVKFIFHGSKGARCKCISFKTAHLVG